MAVLGVPVPSPVRHVGRSRHTITKASSRTSAICSGASGGPRPRSIHPPIKLHPGAALLRGSRRDDPGPPASVTLFRGGAPAVLLLTVLSAPGHRTLVASRVADGRVLVEIARRRLVRALKAWSRVRGHYCYLNLAGRMVPTAPTCPISSHPGPRRKRSDGMGGYWIEDPTSRCPATPISSGLAAWRWTTGQHRRPGDLARRWPNTTGCAFPCTGWR